MVLIPLGFCGGLLAGEGDKNPPSKSVVKIFSTRIGPDMAEPWKKQAAQESSGTGVVIAGKRILTSAHVVSHAASVRVQPDRSGEQFQATVESIASDIDLAVLKLTDESFFDTHPPLPKADAPPRVREQVFVAGYPQGGEALSMTGGIVSRIEFTNFYYGRNGLRVQIDAAVNPGNSGGPALVEGKMTGIVFSTLRQAENIGYLIPVEEIDLFLADVADGHYDGKPVFRDIVQTVQNETLRSRLKLPKGVNGVCVVRPDRDDPSYPLKPFDVITNIADHPIDSSGKVDVHGELRLSFAYLAQNSAKDGKLRLCILRDGKPATVDLPVLTDVQRPKLMPYLHNAYPSYLVWGPLVFSPATQDTLHQYQRPDSAVYWYPYLARQKSPFMSRVEDYPAFEGEQLVIVTAMLPHRITQGYPDTYSVTVNEIDGVRVRNFRHLAELLRDGRGEDVMISFYERDADVLVFNRRAVDEAAEEILSASAIRKPYSDDLKPVFDGHK
jgi:S1-C subfamily serine protease